MDRIPMEWVDMIFDIMSNWFGEKWTKNIDSPMKLEILKTTWQSGLTGLTREEIRKGLGVVKKLARDGMPPPFVCELHLYSKTITKSDTNSTASHAVTSSKNKKFSSKEDGMRHIANLKKIIATGNQYAQR